MMKRTLQQMGLSGPVALCAAIVALCLLAVAPSHAQGIGLEGLRCVDCHPSRDGAVYDILEGRKGVHLGSESAQAFVCFSCHDGTVKDDLSKLTKGRSHPSSIRMPRKVDGNLPLYGNKRIECGTCHTPHAKGSTDLNRPNWLRDDAGGVSQMCQACHPKQSRKHRSHMNMAVKAENIEKMGELGLKVDANGRIGCDTCHAPHGSRYPGLLVAEYKRGDEQGLCGLCHAEKVVTGKVADGGAQPCDNCHAIHGDRENLLAEGDNICLECHTELSGPDHHPVIDVACRDCHSIHSAPKMALTDKTRFLRTIPAGGFLCSNCHQSVLGRHSPETLENVKRTDLMALRGLGGTEQERGDCSFCHEVHYAPNKGLLRLEGAISCLYCHEDPNPFGQGGRKPGSHPVGVPMSAADGGGVGGPEEPGFLGVDEWIAAISETAVGSGEQEVLMCPTCHGPHGDDRAPPECSTCHWETAEKMQGAQHSCAECHPVHGVEAAAERCESCHGLPGDSLHGPAELEEEVPAGLAAVDSKGLLANIGRFGCPTCHNPHGTADKILNNEAPERICLACHEDKSSLLGGAHDMTVYEDGSKVDRCIGCHPVHKSAKDEASLEATCSVCHGEQYYPITAHSAQGAPPWKEGRRVLPLFDRAGKRNDFGFMSCPTCHDVHKGDSPRGFRIESERSEDLCLKCHPNKRSILGSSHDPLKGALISGRSSCDNCHPAHMLGQVPPVWQLPDGAGGTINDQKCSACHGAPKLAATPKDGVGSHPVNITMPEDMTGLGVRTYTASGEVGGRVISCSSCHDVHGVADVSGRVRPQFLRFEMSNGDLCLRCHNDKEAIRETAHDLQDFEERPYGICSPCHGVHGTGEDDALFVLGYDTEAFMKPSGRCRSCHLNSDRPLGQPLMQFHMKDADEALTERGTIFRQYPMFLIDKWATRSDSKPIVSLYNRENEPDSVGWLQCPSCHDPHIWSPLGPNFTPKLMESWHGKKIPTKYTRLKKPKMIKDSVCKQCHEDGIMKLYWDYHIPNDVVGNSFLRTPPAVIQEDHAADTTEVGAVETEQEGAEAQEVGESPKATEGQQVQSAPQTGEAAEAVETALPQEGEAGKEAE